MKNKMVRVLIVTLLLVGATSTPVLASGGTMPPICPSNCRPPNPGL
jgi:hypothetical protein